MQREGAGGWGQDPVEKVKGALGIVVSKGVAIVSINVDKPGFQCGACNRSCCCCSTLPGLALPCLFVRVCACMTLGDKTNGERGERNGGGREMSVPRYRGATVSRNSLLLHTHACIMLGDHVPHLRIHFIQVLPDQACHIGLDDSQPCQIAQYVCLSVSLSIHHEYIHPSIHPVTIAFMHAYLHTCLEHGLCLKNGRVLQAGD